MIARGDWVRVKGERGLYQVQRDQAQSKDGSVLLYGGDKDPKGHRQFRAVMPDKLVPTTGYRDKRKD